MKIQNSLLGFLGCVEFLVVRRFIGAVRPCAFIHAANHFAKLAVSAITIL